MSRLPIVDKLDQELKESHQELQVEIPKAIKTAREHGDLSENAEYHAAKEEQSHLEFKIAKLKNVVSSARIIDESQLDMSKILIHSVVKLKNTTNKMEFTYTMEH